VEYKASQYVNILRRLEPYSVIQAEDCLMLNIYVPFKGRLRDKITHNYHCYYALDKKVIIIPVQLPYLVVTMRGSIL
jgi:hypothetical protein